MSAEGAVKAQIDSEIGKLERRLLKRIEALEEALKPASKSTSDSKTGGASTK